jgi:hypothetical protein
VAILTAARRWPRFVESRRGHARLKQHLSVVIDDAQCQLKALAKIGSGEPHTSNEIEELAAVTYGIAFNDN